MGLVFWIKLFWNSQFLLPAKFKDMCLLWRRIEFKCDTRRTKPFLYVLAESALHTKRSASFNRFGGLIKNVGNFAWCITNCIRERNCSFKTKKKSWLQSKKLFFSCYAKFLMLKVFSNFDLPSYHRDALLLYGNAGPTEYFKIKWGLNYLLQAICPDLWFKTGESHWLRSK